MASIATGQFPQITFRKGEKHLWNPIQKKAFKNRPEERIRLRVIEYMLAVGWSKHRISTEEGIRSAQKGALRTDLICYTQTFDPYLLVECKAPSVNISNQTAEQIARYNKQVEARYLLMTNGQIDLWYKFNEEGQPQLLDTVPDSIRGSDQPGQKSLQYWVERGFSGRSAGPRLRLWLEPVLNRLVAETEKPLQYLAFNDHLDDLDLSHYYTIVPCSGSRIAIGFIATAYGDTRLVAIENRAGTNRAVLVINLDRLFKDETPNASLYDESGIENRDVSGLIDQREDTFWVSEFAQNIQSVFSS